ncbi:MAG: excalibur calcium-binding domain-containing protein [Methylococcales bacterium]|nr:excalibur calcium-binding domain-containing protein [Methylococcales bacterium]
MYKGTLKQWNEDKGREHCSQMNSRAEAVFFIRNCPNTKMDGDSDGIPCENDSRF